MLKSAASSAQASQVLPLVITRMSRRQNRQWHTSHSCAQQSQNAVRQHSFAWHRFSSPASISRSQDWPSRSKGSNTYDRFGSPGGVIRFHTAAYQSHATAEVLR